MKEILKVMGLILLASLIGCSKDSDSNKVIREDFLGTYDCFQTCDGSEDTYEMTILAGNADDEVIITALYERYSANDKATVNGNKLEINQQNGLNVLTANGELDGNILTMTFHIEIDRAGWVHIDDCTVVCTKQ